MVAHNNRSSSLPIQGHSISARQVQVGSVSVDLLGDARCSILNQFSFCEQPQRRSTRSARRRILQGK